MALAVSTVYIFWKQSRSPVSSGDASVPPNGETSAEASASRGQSSEADSEIRELTPSERSKVAQLPSVIQPVSRSGTNAVPEPAGPAPTPYTRQLVAALTNLNFAHGPITKEQAEQWKQGLQVLTQQGAAAVPAIDEFLKQNQELNFAAVTGGDLLGQSSLRSALINALTQIGGPEASAVMLQTLQTTTLPSEIAQLAQALEQVGPGQYRQQTLDAVNEVLGMASKGQLPGWDVGTLFKVLQTYGDSSTASALEQLAPQWKYYATMSLAGLEGGAGIPSLIHEAQDSTAGAKRDFAFQMLAQAASQYTDASSALIDQARLNQIPDSAWRKIATGLAGDQYQIGTSPPGVGPNGGSWSGLKTYHIQSGNQNFYSLPVGPDGQVSQRLDLIAQLLRATSNPVAIAALQNARDILSGQMPPR